MIAREFDLPVLLVPNSARIYADTHALLGLCSELGLAPDRVVVTRSDFTTLRAVVRFGALACVSVGPDQMKAPDAARMLHEFNPLMWRNLALSTSSVAGATDVLAIPKLLRELNKFGLDASRIRAVSCENTRRWLDRGRVGRGRPAPAH
jgi:predicted metal-dependent TIM-barrel fold hydrolase